MLSSLKWPKSLLFIYIFQTVRKATHAALICGPKSDLSDVTRLHGHVHLTCISLSKGHYCPDPCKPRPHTSHKCERPRRKKDFTGNWALRPAVWAWPQIRLQPLSCLEESEYFITVLVPWMASLLQRPYDWVKQFNMRSNRVLKCTERYF